MPTRFTRMLALICCLVMAASLMPTSYAAGNDNIGNATVANETPTAIFGTPELGSNDPLWSQTMEHHINKSTVPTDTRPHATGTARILWDHDYLYARVAVNDSNLYQGAGGDHRYDSLEFYVGNGSGGSNQWRVSATGVFSGQAAPGRAAWTQITETGYIVEMRIPKRNLILQEGKLTFEVYINNSTEQGGDRYEVVSSFGVPDAAYTSSASFTDSLQLIPANELDTRLSITATVGPGGSIMSNPPGDVLRVDRGSNKEITFTPDSGKVVDTATVDGEIVNLSDGTYTFSNIEADHTIHVTFKNDLNAEILPFIVWNDNFASGEYTTAVIIDLGEGKAALGSELNPRLFALSARNTTLNGEAVTFEGTRKITRVYANDEPKVRGYLGPISNSPDYQDGLESGRYIVVESEFYSESGGTTTLDGSSNSTKQVYTIVQKGEIVLTEGNPLHNVVFEQEKVVNPILDQFATFTDNSVNRSLYLHKDENGNVMKGLPLYVYTHGMSRGGTNAGVDQKAAMKSANGSVALMKKMAQKPEKYASHILNISYNGVSVPSTEHVKKVIDALIASGEVDPNRVYAAGFSWGGQYTNNLVNSHPGFFAAAAPMAPVSGSPNANTNNAHNTLAYWMFLNAHNVGGYQTNLNNYINTNMPKMINARASRFESNEALTWPYNQFDQPNLRPNPDNTPVLADYIAHEVEAAVLYNQITMGSWSMAPTAQSSNLPAWNNNYTDVFDWMFAQRKAVVPGTPSGFKATAGDRRVTLSWTAPVDDGGSVILGYKVWYDNAAPVILDAAETQYTFKELTNGRSYSFKIIAVNAKGDGAEIRVTTMPTAATTPTLPDSGGNTGNISNSSNIGNTPNTSNTGTGTNAGMSKLTYTVNTPKDKPAVTDKNGNTTLPGGGKLVTKGGTNITVPEGTSIDSNGKATIPADKSAQVTLPRSKSTVTIPGGSIIASDGTVRVGGKEAHINLPNGNQMHLHEGSRIRSDGTVMVGPDGARFGLKNDMSLNIRGDAELAFNDAIPLGFLVVSGNPFMDTTMDDWFYSYVNCAYTYDLFNGTTSTTFAPGTAMTRAMFVQVLANLENINHADYTGSRFRDVSDGPWYTAAVEWAAEKGIVNGVSPDQFDPHSPMTREQMLVILYNYMEYKGYEIPESHSKSFADESEISSWALEAVQALREIGIVLGKPDNLFAPIATATRAEVATIFVRFVERLAK
ncbi:S-layer homology domain-containing protein [Paenibacillus barcinonensis]|uniref:Putative peptidase n=1 Tax=Paenibacillus barcinonensis TaxID=198119 RepID=A0A2V4WJ56_PAEBA|nr:S-layer homology domain-containing protein [Paenibacillus barcinonensis]PYE52448.1 putative peptidase [Paenibacillus barcinonensis]QKS59443.1 S-layer homology domain-containing protein [Paenibacillus barcinonensis]